MRWYPDESRLETFVCFSNNGLHPDSIHIQKSGENLLDHQSWALRLLPAICHSKPSRFESTIKTTIFPKIHPRCHQDGQKAIRLALPVLPDTTNDQRCLTQASAWFKECLENHTRCNQFLGVHTTETLPSRLLAVGSETAKLVATEHLQNPKVPLYMTVSHKWQRRMPKLLQCNIEDMKQGVSIFELPQTFQDTFQLAMALQIRYIWIDALCILQDDDVDKASEILKMSHIYRHAILNVGAVAAADAIWRSDTDSASNSGIGNEVETGMYSDDNTDLSNDTTAIWHPECEDTTSADEQDCVALDHSPTQPERSESDFATAPEPGLFIDRDPLEHSAFAVEIKREDREYDCLVSDWDPLWDFHDSALFKRGWVLQERLLSPRTLFFGQQIVWECSELVASEAFPFGVPEPQMRPNVRLGKSLTERNEVNRHFAQHKAWMNVVQTFSECQLTYDSDCFPALSGLAHSYQASLQEKYYAGLWENDFIPGLCWHRKDQDFDAYPAFPDEYRGNLNSLLHTRFLQRLTSSAPSWSWASVKFPVEYPGFDQNGDDEVPYACVGRVEEIDVTPSGTDALGSISSAHLLISGHLRKAIRSLSRREIRRMPSWTVDHAGVQYEWFDSGYEGENLDYRDISTAYFLLLVHQEWSIHYNTGGADRLIGIIVEPIDDNETKWRRIGAFDHPSGDGWMEQEYSPGYPEFDGWDPENYERHTIMII